MPDVTVDATNATLAVPFGSAGSEGPWPGVVVIHEAFGLNADTRAHADRLAALGYLALAPDLLDGKLWLRCIRSMFRALQGRAGAGGVGSALRGPGRVPRLAGRAPRLHRQDRGDRLLHGRRLRAAVRAAR